MLYSWQSRDVALPTISILSTPCNEVIIHSNLGISLFYGHGIASRVHRCIILSLKSVRTFINQAMLSDEYQWHMNNIAGNLVLAWSTA